MATQYTHKSENITKTWLLMTAFFGLIIAIGFIISIVLNNGAYLVFASVFAIATSVWSYWFSDKMVLKMTKAKEVSRANLKDLYEIVDNLAITAGIPTPKIYVIDDAALNAFATGRNPEHSVIVFTRGLLEKLNEEEIKGVAAHEMAHILNRDMLVGTIAVIFTSIIAMTSRIMFFSGDSRRGGGAAMLVGLLLLILAPLLAMMLRLAISRKREFLADASGALLTRYPEGLASALEKISTDNKPVLSASDTTAHLFIANPLKNKNKKFFSKLFMTHPPIEERVARLRDMDKG